MPDVLSGAAAATSVVVAGLIIAGASAQLLLGVSAAIELRRIRAHEKHQLWRRVLGSPLAPKITVLVPAYNEEVSIAESVAGVLALSYPNLEVVVVDDGSRDETLERLTDAFNLEPVHPIYQRRIPTAEVAAIYRSSAQPRLVVVQKQNGGKADALNCALNVASGELVCAIDADTLVTPDCLQQMVTSFISDTETVAVGGTVRLVNDADVHGGVVTRARAPRGFLAGAQAVEYTRAFLIGRLGWNLLGGNLLISGAFGLFRRDRLIDVGGYEVNSVGEDMELIVRLRRRGYETDQPTRVHFTPDPIAWTEAPESLGFLSRQRNRWHRGLFDVISRHRRMILNPRYRSAGLLGLPYFLVVEAIAPIVEFVGLILLLVGLPLGITGVPELLVVAMSILFSMVVTLLILVLDELGFRSYPGLVARLRLIGYVLFEQLVFRPLTLLWRMWGVKMYFQGRSEWGDMARRGFSGVSSPSASS